MLYAYSACTARFVKGYSFGVDMKMGPLSGDHHPHPSLAQTKLSTHPVAVYCSKPPNWPKKPCATSQGKSLNTELPRLLYRLDIVNVNCSLPLFILLPLKLQPRGTRQSRPIGRLSCPHALGCSSRGTRQSRPIGRLSCLHDP